MKKIVESFRKNNEHLIFNSQFIKIISKIENKNIKVYCKKNHSKELRKFIKEQNIEFINLLGNSKNGKINNLIGYICSAFYDIAIILLSKKEDEIIYTNINPLSLFLMRIINKKIKRDISMVCHGELETLLRKDELNFFQ